MENRTINLSEAKMLGGIGSILTLLAIIPSVGVFLAIVGLVLVLFAVKYASDALGDRKIFNETLYAVVLGIVGLVVAGVSFAAFAFRALGISSLPFTAPTPAAVQWSDAGFWSVIGVVILGLTVVWACFLASSVFVYRSYGALGKKVGVGLFGTASLLFLIGAVTTIILVGFVLLFVAQILFIIAFFSINAEMPLSPSKPAP
ncbi:MAG TPA: DUF996 domain-containing protein [Nitrososphaerales archaeon]|nr:DUF996 domain-containing protein [Nitrososphaerales archaeon]